MRVVHTSQNIGGMAGVLAESQRAIGLDAVAYCLDTGRYNFKQDKVIENDTLSKQLKLVRDEVFSNLGKDFCFQYYFGESLVGPSLWEVPIIKKLGGKVCFCFCGCDIRDSKYVIKTYKDSACLHCWPMNCSGNREKVLAYANKYADCIFVTTPDLLEFVENSVWMPQPLKTSNFDDAYNKYCERLNSRESNFTTVDIRIAHAPSNRQLKGTDIIIECINRMNAKGWRIELVLLENMEHSQVLEEMLGCDLAIDQTHIGAYGQFSVEAMAMGIPTVCHIRDDLLCHFPKDLPIISANVENLEMKLQNLFEFPEQMKTLSRRSRDYAVKHHDSLVVAQLCAEKYKILN